MDPLPLFEEPVDAPILLSTPARLASWDAADHLDQVKLRSYLDATELLAQNRLGAVMDPLSLSLAIGLPAGTALLRDRDLDNYLLPLVTRFVKSGRTVVSVWGSKKIADQSFLTIATAQARHLPQVGRAPLQLLLTASSQAAAFKLQIRSGIADLPVIPAGQVSVELSFVVGPSRNWLNLWKPTIDSLGSVLGSSPGSPEWHPDDGRIVRLALHCRVDRSLKNDVILGVQVGQAVQDDATDPEDASGPLVSVPDISDGKALEEFALSYNAYEVHGTDRAAKIALAIIRGWHHDGRLPETLDTLRAALFWLQRQHRHTEDPQPFGGDAVVSAIVEKIRVQAPQGVPRIGSEL